MTRCAAEVANAATHIAVPVAIFPSALCQECRFPAGLAAIGLLIAAGPRRVAEIET